MSTREQARKHGERLQAGIPSAFPAASVEIMRREVVECLLRNCRDDSHVERTVTRVLEAAENPRNLLAAITRAARETVEHHSPAQIWDRENGGYVDICSPRGLELIHATQEQRKELRDVAQTRRAG